MLQKSRSRRPRRCSRPRRKCSPAWSKLSTITRKKAKRHGEPSPRRPGRKKERRMPQGDKSSYTDKQKRQAAHIEAGYEKKGLSVKTSEARAWATVNKLDGGGKKSGSGRKRPN